MNLSEGENVGNSVVDLDHHEVKSLTSLAHEHYVVDSSHHTTR